MVLKLREQVISARNHEQCQKERIMKERDLWHCAPRRRVSIDVLDVGLSAAQSDDDRDK
jgi:hypothetical protein